MAGHDRRDRAQHSASRGSRIARAVGVQQRRARARSRASRRRPRAPRRPSRAAARPSVGRVAGGARARRVSAPSCERSASAWSASWPPMRGERRLAVRRGTRRRRPARGRRRSLSARPGVGRRRGGGAAESRERRPRRASAARRVGRSCRRAVRERGRQRLAAEAREQDRRHAGRPSVRTGRQRRAALPERSTPDAPARGPRIAPLLERSAARRIAAGRLRPQARRALPRERLARPCGARRAPPARPARPACVAAERGS